MKKFIVLGYVFLTCFTIQAQEKAGSPKFYLDGGVSYNIIDQYNYYRIGNLTDLPLGLFSIRVNLGFRGDIMLDNENRIGARVRLVFLNYGYKSTDYYITELPLELTWTIYQNMPLYFFAGYCIPVLDGIGGVDFGVHAEYRGFFIEVAPKIYIGGAFGLSGMLGYSYHFEN